MRSTLNNSRTAAWFCVRTQTKREHIAAAQLRQERDIAVFLPRIRFRRTTRRGPAWVTEALFPGYLFARFDLASCLRRVKAARGVRGVVHFGNQWPAVPDSIIGDLKAVLGNEEVKTVSENLEPGDNVNISHGAFRGLEAVVTRVMPGRQRIAVLLDFLGRQTPVELTRDQVSHRRSPRVSL